MPHVMIDLETLGTEPGSIILSIGAVVFDPAKDPEDCIVSEFYVVVDALSCKQHGMTKDPSTIEWWKKQSEEAQKVLAQAMSGDPDMCTPLPEALKALAEFIPANSMVWSNGANFDQPLLDVAYRRVEQPLPWKFWNSRCYRTILSLYPNQKEVAPPTVLAHDALQDSIWQSKHMVNVAKLAGLKL